MFKEWYRTVSRSRGYSAFKEIDKFLRENSKTEFSRSDIKFFLKTYGLFPDVIIKFIDALPLNEKRIRTVIQICEEDGDYKRIILKSLRLAISNRIPRCKDFLFRNFPITLITPYDFLTFYSVVSASASALYSLCCIYQNLDIDNNLLKQYRPHWGCCGTTVIWKLIKLLPKDNYIQYLPILMGDEYNNFVRTKIQKLLKRLRKIIKKTNVFRKKKLFPSEKMRERYIHFILKKIVTPQIKSRKFK